MRFVLTIFTVKLVFCTKTLKLPGDVRSCRPTVEKVRNQPGMDTMGDELS